MIRLVIISLFCSKLFAQSVSNDVLDSLYLNAIENRFDLSLSSGYKYFELNQNIDRIKNKVRIDIFKFLNESELIKIANKEKKAISLIRVSHKQISKDTIDINFGEVSVTAYKSENGLENVIYSVGCGGTQGYSPDIRFAYNKVKNVWQIIKNKYVTK